MRKRKWILCCIVLVSVVIGTMLTLHFRRHQDGRYTFSRDFSDEKIDNLRKNNFHLKHILNSENKLDLNKVTLSADTKMSESAREKIVAGFLEKAGIHKNILWAYHLSGRYRAANKALIIPMENGVYLSLEHLNDNHYHITVIQSR